MHASALGPGRPEPSVGAVGQIVTRARRWRARGHHRQSATPPPPKPRTFSYESLNEVLLKASLTQSWARQDWAAVQKIIFGWTANLALFAIMGLTFNLYGCELFEPRDDPAAPPAGNTDELIIAWILSAFQRFVLHEPTLILAAKGLPILFASSFCANCCGESIVNLLSIFFTGVMACLAEIKG